MRNLSGNPENKSKLGAAGACEAVVMALRKHGVEGSNAGVAEQVSVCRCGNVTVSVCAYEVVGMVVGGVEAACIW